MKTLDDDIRSKLKSIVDEYSGLYFRDYAIKDLEAAVLQRMAERGLALPLDYINLISFSADRENEFRELLNLLTVNHTYFFRNEPQFKVLKERILPEVISRKLQKTFFSGLKQNGKPSLRIWSAGSSTGEEPYTIAMIVRELIRDLENWDVHILATDASQNALDKAKKGVFGANSVKGVSEHYLKKYFAKVDRASRAPEYQIGDEIKQMVTFGYFNLIDENYPRDFDIIFCRNVVIYFKQETILKVMLRMHESLAKEGYFFIGYSETLQFMMDKFKIFCVDDAIYYRKAEEKETIPGLTPVKRDVEKTLEEISLKQAIAEIEAELKRTPEPKNIESLLIDAIRFTRMKSYDKALFCAAEAERLDPVSAEPLYCGAEILLSQGRLNEAKTKLDKALTLNPFFAAAHYLHGCIFLEQALMDEAKKSFKKALYLEPDFFLAHFYLAQAHKTESRTNEAIREYRNTAKLLSHLSPEDIIPYSGGFNAATILSVCHDNIERLKLAIE